MIETIQRIVAETSQRTMLTNLVGILLSTSLIGDNESIPKEYRLDMKNATDGLKLSRAILAEALNVPVEHVHFLNSELVFNFDDMAAMYSQLGGLKKDVDPGLVLKENMNSSNRCYSAHLKEALPRPKGATHEPFERQRQDWSNLASNPCIRVGTAYGKVCIGCAGSTNPRPGSGKLIVASFFGPGRKLILS